MITRIAGVVLLCGTFLVSAEQPAGSIVEEIEPVQEVAPAATETAPPQEVPGPAETSGTDERRQESSSGTLPQDSPPEESIGVDQSQGQRDEAARLRAEARELREQAARIAFGAGISRIRWPPMRPT